LVGNHDAHGKSFSLLYSPDTHRAALAPAYDILCTVAYRNDKPMSRKMAMKTGGEYRPDWVRSRHLAGFFGDAKLGPAASRRRLHALALEAPSRAVEVRSGLAAEGWDADVLAVIEHVVRERSRLLVAITAPIPVASRRAPTTR
jgi:serine/threonine-protein kinase HipA